MAMFSMPFRRKQGDVASSAPLQSPLPRPAPEKEKAKETEARPPRLARDATVDDQISALMAELKEEAVALKCRQEQVLSDWQIGLDALAGKMATLQPLMNKSMQGSADPPPKRI